MLKGDFSCMHNCASHMCLVPTEAEVSIVYPEMGYRWL